MNWSYIWLCLRWIIACCIVAFAGSLYLRQELQKGKKLAGDFVNMIKNEGFTGKRVIEGFASATSYKEINNQPLKIIIFIPLPLLTI